MIKWLRLAVRAYDSFQDDDGMALAGHMAFSALLGLFPFVILVSNIAAVAIGPDLSQEAIDALFIYAPDHVAQTLEPVLRDVLKGAGGSLLTVSALAALWFSSNAVEAVRTGFDRAYNAKKRHHWLVGRLISVCAVLLGLIVSITLGVVIVLGPLLLSVAESWLNIKISAATVLLRYGIGLTVFVLYLLFLHSVLPRHRLPVRKLWPGVLVSTIIWLTAATGFSIYLGYTPTYASTYGTLAGVVITLVFFYITGMAFIFGAEVNAVLWIGKEE